MLLISGNRAVILFLISAGIQTEKAPDAGFYGRHQSAVGKYDSFYKDSYELRLVQNYCKKLIEANLAKLTGEVPKNLDKDYILRGKIVFEPSKEEKEYTKTMESIGEYARMMFKELVIKNKENAEPDI